MSILLSLVLFLFNAILAVVVVLFGVIVVGACPVITIILLRDPDRDAIVWFMIMLCGAISVLEILGLGILILKHFGG